MKLSVITATYNAIEHLPKLIESLRNQEDKDFEWVVADGASTDGTLELLSTINDINIKITSQEDFGIYDALNRAIKISAGDFYLIVGADDILYPNAIFDYKAAVELDSDIITGLFTCGNKLFSPRGRWGSCISAQFAYVSGHAVGSIYKKSLHEKFGYYSRKLPIAADQLFILKAAKGGAKIKKIESVVGDFNLGGVSSIDRIGALTESYRAQIMVGEGKFVQTFLFFLRIVKNYKKF